MSHCVPPCPTVSHFRWDIFSPQKVSQCPTKIDFFFRKLLKFYLMNFVGHCHWDMTKMWRDKSYHGGTRLTCSGTCPTVVGHVQTLVGHVQVLVGHVPLWWDMVNLWWDMSHRGGTFLSSKSVPCRPPNFTVLLKTLTHTHFFFFFYHGGARTSGLENI